ncbi:hypothetical protein CA234_09560 [Sphingomonas sp. ABOLE]|uniref:hypothetical protein n=1 Tax=Sphingomonas sp. ABOLE TaxID=1985878 RepID=UPI000F7F9908|nr:hypothetical protein [Sphingomonas sp. ABOLE]RSV41510.1 hypothetical protein CA234_09560 [Sphingomonas sp. ABOLE]
MAYADRTEVAFEKSIAEIVGMLRRAGAQSIGQMDEPTRFTIQFALADRLVRFAIAMPSIEDAPKRDGRGAALDAKQRSTRREQMVRQRGRALMLVIKAKLESVESKVETFEEAFLANVVMANGQTLYERVAEPIAVEYRTGAVQPSSTLFLSGPRNG